MVKRILALMLSLALCILMCSCGRKTANSSARKNEPVMNKYANLKEDPHPKLSGTFIQSWLCSSWSDERWEKELQNLKDLGMEYIIMGDSAVYSKNNFWYTYYPSSLSDLKDGKGQKDVIGNALRNCQKFGFKVFVGMGFDNNWWDKFVSDPDWLNSYMKKTNEIAGELYNMYHEKYSDTFYGWYWVPEIWNDNSFSHSSSTRDENIKTLANAMSISLDYLTQLDSKMPMLFSPFVNIEMISAKDTYKLWRDLLNVTHFRKGDILCPMDSIGAGGCKLSCLDVWTKSYRRAVDENGIVKLWSNSEDFYTYDTVKNKFTSANVDRFVRQMQIASKYVEKIITFAYSHYYSPYNALSGYNETYQQYLNTGELEKEAPSAPQNLKVKYENDDIWLKWDAATDNIGIAGYHVYRNGEIIDNIYSKRGKNGPIPKLSTDSYVGTVEQISAQSYSVVYEVEAFDFAGNLSEKAKIKIPT